jgi:predicted dehydrogenase
VTRLRALLVGLGQIGCGYDADLPFQRDQPRSSPRTLSHARALACHPGFELLGGVDPSPTARQRFTGLYGLPAHADLAAWRAASTGPDPELVVIAVAPQLQPGLVEQLLSLTAPRLLLLEKPVAASLAQARALERTCARQPGLVVAVNYIRRYLPAVQAWQQRLLAGELGALLHGQITYGKGLLSNGSHFVNLAEAWLGPLRPGRLLDPGPACFGFDREASLELQAQAHGGAPLLVRSVGAAGLRAGELDLWFEEGRLCWRNDGQAIAFWPRRPAALGDSHAALAAEPELTPTGLEHYQHVVLEALVRHWRDPQQAPLQCSLSDGVRTLETLASACADLSEPGC